MGPDSLSREAIFRRMEELMEGSAEERERLHRQEEEFRRLHRELRTSLEELDAKRQGLVARVRQGMKKREDLLEKRARYVVAVRKIDSFLKDLHLASRRLEPALQELKAREERLLKEYVRLLEGLAGSLRPVAKARAPEAPFAQPESSKVQPAQRRGKVLDLPRPAPMPPPPRSEAPSVSPTPQAPPTPPRHEESPSLEKLLVQYRDTEKGP